MGHLEDPTLGRRPAGGPRVRRGHDRPAAVDLDGLHRRRASSQLLAGLASVGAAVRLRAGGRRSCSAAPGARPTGCCKESAVWRDRNTDEVQAAQRDADYAYRLAVDPPGGQGAAAVRPGRLDPRPLHSPAAASSTTSSTRPPACGSGRCCGCLVVVVAANARRVLGAGRRASADGRLDLGQTRRVRPGGDRRVGSIAFGGLNWALDGAAAPAAAVLRLRAAMAPGRRAAPRHAAGRRPPARTSCASAT